MSIESKKECRREVVEQTPSKVTKLHPQIITRKR